MTNLQARDYASIAAGPLPADAELLARWRAGNDTDALETLIRRHGGMVYGVCRRVLGNTPDAQDAFQATFLIFVRKAGTLDRPAKAAGWLHAVALRVARKTRATRTRRQAREVVLVDIADPTNSDGADDLRRTLDEELDRLPEKYRLPIVLCELEGRTLEEAAQLLGWPKGTVAGRLSRGREMLRQRLSRRGVCLPLFLPGAVAVESESPPDQLVCETIAAAIGAPGSVSPPAALADAVPWSGIRRFGLLVIVFITVAAPVALGWFARPAAAEPTEPTTPTTPTPTLPAQRCGCSGSAS